MKFLNSAFIKETLRTIKHSWTRYLAIIAMSALSTMVFIGLSSGVPNLRDLILNRIQQHQPHDIKISSYTGLRDKDIDLINQETDYDLIEYGYTKEVNQKDLENSFRLFSLSNNIDTVVITDGRLPKNDKEILLDVKYYQDTKTTLNESITLDDTTYTIVGYGKRPDFILNTRQNINYFGITDFENEYYDYALLKDSTQSLSLISDEYKQLEASRINHFTDLFKTRPNQVKNELLKEANDKIAQGRQEIVDGYQELEDSKKKLDDANQELIDAKVELDDGLKEIKDAQQEISDNQAKLNREINNGQNEINDGRIKLEQTQQELNDGRRQLEDGKVQLAQAREQLEQAKTQLATKEQELQEGLVRLDDGIAQTQVGLVAIGDGLDQLNYTKEQLEQGLSQIEAQEAPLLEQQQILTSQLEQVNQGIKQVQLALEADSENTSLQAQLQELQIQVAALEEGLNQVNTGLQQIAQNKAPLEAGITDVNIQLADLSAQQEELQNTKIELEAQKEQALSGKQQLESSKEEIAANEEEELNTQAQLLADKETEINEGQATIDANRQDLQQAQTTLNNEKESGQRQLDEAQQTLNEAKAEYDQGLLDYQQGLQEYQEGLKEYQEKYPGAIEDLQQAQKDIDEAKEQLKQIRVPQYVIEGKYNNEAFNSYVSQADSLNTLSLIFTVMFYLVAILVTLTTLLRMVETQRTQIGTLKALGYSRRRILNKFLFYGLSATIIGSLLGIVIGYYGLMPPILKAYMSSTDIKGNPMIFEPFKALFIFLLSLIVIGLTVILSVSKNLRENTASLMRPKPPKPSKRILLERIPIIWNKLSFLNKVSIRNVLRSKVRMFMTLLGVAGSFSLIAMAMGVQGSIARVADKQFKEVYQYTNQVMINPDEDDVEDLREDITQQYPNAYSLITTQGTLDNPNGLKESISIVATDDPLDHFINLRERESQKPLLIEPNKVIISEKISSIYELDVSDTLTFNDPNGLEVELEISGISEQYLSHQIVMSQETYHKSIDAYQENNAYLIKDETLNTSQFNDYDSYITSIATKDLENTLTDISQSLSLVIVLIIALSALLTFVVLYNLTNINISERFREISTIKVLGFRPKEVISYIFKETLILTFIGMGIGVILAKIMHYLIVYSLSPGAILFDPYLDPIVYLWSGLIVLTFTLLVMYLSKREMDQINMVEALKAVD